MHIWIGGSFMAIKFYGLERQLDKKGFSRGDLQKKIGASSTTIAKLSRHEYVSLSTIEKICRVLDCQPGDIMEHVED